MCRSLPRRSGSIFRSTKVKVKLLLERYAEQLGEMIRFYQAGLVNTAFGFGLYTLFVYLGMNLFAAQLSSHACGMVFNYFTFQKHVFRSSNPKIFRYISSYAVNYFVSLALLAGFHRLVH